MPSKTTVKYILVESKFIRPLSYGKSLSLISQQSIRPRVVVLFRWSCPDAIFRCVTQIIILSFKRMICRSFTHISKKVFKRLLPAVTDSNSACAVIGKRSRLWIMATRNHTGPSPIGAGIRIAMAMLTIAVAVNYCGLSMKATTTFLSSKIASTNHNSLTAITSTFPYRIALSYADESNSDQSSKSLIGDIYDFRHVGLLLRPILLRAGRERQLFTGSSFI